MQRVGEKSSIAQTQICQPLTAQTTKKKFFLFVVVVVVFQKKRGINYLGLCKLGHVVDIVNSLTAALVNVKIVVNVVRKEELFTLGLGCSLDELVKNVVVALILGLVHYARAFKQVRSYLC